MPNVRLVSETAPSSPRPREPLALQARRSVRQLEGLGIGRSRVRSFPLVELPTILILITLGIELNPDPKEFIPIPEGENAPAMGNLMLARWANVAG